MTTIGRRPLLLAQAMLLVAGASGGARAEHAPLRVRWKAPSPSRWPPATVGDRIFVIEGDRLACYRAASGRRRWSRPLGARVVAGPVEAAGRIAVLAQDRLMLLSADTGAVMQQRRLVAGLAGSMLVSGDRVYFTDSRGVHRLRRGERAPDRSAPFDGKLLAVDGDHALLFRRVDPPSQRVAQGKPRPSPRRLIVVDLVSGRRLYRFKLLARGSVVLVRFGAGRLAFIDHSRRQPDGRNPRKLFYTEIDYRAGRKLRDVALSTLYRRDDRDRFAVAAGGGALLLANLGQPGIALPALLVSFDPQSKRARWKREDLHLSAPIRKLASSAELLAGSRSADGAGRLMALDVQTGRTLVSVKLDGPPVDSPRRGAGCLLARTATSLYCLERGEAAVVAAAGRSAPATASPPAGWRVHDDPLRGFRLQLPDSWQLARRHVRRLGRGRHAIPFVRYRRRGGRWTIEASLHVLIREAAGQNAASLWDSVRRFRQQQDPRLRVIDHRRVSIAGGVAGGVAAIEARYWMRGPGARWGQWRSLCLVHGGRAYELRAWAAAPVWPQIERITRSFVPLGH